MQYNNIITSICAITALSSMASADIQFPLESLPTTPNLEKPFSALLSTGYSSNYVSRGLVFQNSGTNNVIPLEAVGAYQLNNKYSIIGGLKYQWMTENGFEHDRVGIADESTAILGISRKLSNWTTVALSYQFVNGGLPGSLNTHQGPTSGFPAFEHTRTEEHSFALDLHHEFGKGLDGFFWDSRTQYTFRWESGWWFTNTLGYKYDVNKAVSVIFSGTWNVTAGYFNRNALNANGTQGISLNVEVPWKATDHLTISPFLGTVWLGNGGMAANHRAGTEKNPTRQSTQVYRNFTLVAGVGLSYSF